MNGYFDESDITHIRRLFYARSEIVVLNIGPDGTRSGVGIEGIGEFACEDTLSLLSTFLDILVGPFSEQQTSLDALRSFAAQKGKLQAKLVVIALEI